MLKAIHGKSDSRTTSDGIYAILVAQFIGFSNGRQVRYAAVGSESGDRLVLRPTVERVHRDWTLRYLNYPFAADSAGIARIPLFEDGLRHPAASDGFPVLQGTTAPVVTGQIIRHAPILQKSICAINGQFFNT